VPFVRISLKEGSTTEFKKGVSTGVHQALVDIFKIPAEDLFQVIEEVKQENLIFPPEYMGIPHTNKIIYISIIAKEGRSAQMKQELYKKISENIETATKHNSDDIIITMVENKEENWSFGRGEAQLIS